MSDPYGPWQRPDYKGDDIYPPFGCWDSMRSGGVNIGSTRQLVHDLLAEVLGGGWEAAVASYGEQACTPEQYNQFLHDLLDLRGEFGRLLLVLAAAERAEIDRRDAVLAPHGPIVNITPGDPDAVQLPPPWWETDLAAPVVDQLRRCLAILDDDLSCGCGDGLSAKQDAKCGNCIAADRSGLELRYEAMRSVARRLNDGWRPGKNMAVVVAGSPRPEPVPIWMPPEPRSRNSEPMSPAERRALDELEADRG